MTQLLLKLFVKDYNNIADIKVRERYGTFAGAFGIFLNILLCLMKVTVGLFSASISIVADGLNNLSDMGSSVITMICFKLANKPADLEHPYGHGRLEYLSAFIVSMLILVLGFELFTSSASSLIKNEAMPEYSAVTLVILAVSALIKLYMYSFNRTLSKKISSLPLEATAKDSLNDAVASSVILLGAIVSKLVVLPFNLDAVMGLFVSLFIFWAGITTAKDTIAQLLGQPPEPKLLEQIENTVLSFADFMDIHDLIVHNYGSGRIFASVHVEVDMNINIVHCHEQVDLCEKLVEEKTGVMLTIHMDPVNTNDDEVKKLKQQVSEKIKTIDSRITIHDFRTTPTGQTRTNLIFDAVVPAGFKMKKDEFCALINSKVKELDDRFVCVITVDTDFTGRI